MSDVGIIIDLDDQSIERSKVVLDYTSRDFTAIRAQLVGLAKGLMPDWQTTGEAPDFGTLMIELFSYMGDTLHYYIDRTASEAFLGTAVRRQSVLYIADMMGYQPVGQQSASVGLTFSIAADDPDQPGLVVPVTIPRGTRVYNETNNADELVVFELVTDVNLDPKVPGVNEEDKRTVIAYGNEGITVRDRPAGSALGSPNTEVIIPDKGVIYNSVGVTTREGVQVVTWSYVSHLSSARPTQAVFTTFMDETGMTHIIFGDNASGRIPPVNAEFFISYRYGVGARANLLPANTIKGIANVANVDLTTVAVTNKASPIGGTDPESIDSMRFSISRGGSRLRQRAVTLNDYAELAMQVPGVAKSVAHGAVYTAVHVRVAPIDGKADANYMDRLLNSVESYLQDKIMIGSQVYPEPPDVAELWQDVYIQILIHVQDAYDRTAVRLQVEQVVRQLLNFSVVDFGTRISIGLIYRAVLAVQGVEYAELEWLNTTAPVDDTDPGQGDTADVFRTTYRHDTSTTMGDPTAGKYRRNNVTNPTALAFSTTDAAGVAQNVMNLQVGDHIVYSPVGDPNSWMSLLITTAPVNNTTWYQVAVSKLDQAVVVNPPTNNQQVLFSVLRYKPTPDSLGGVHDIETDELLIPRITPPLTLAEPATVSNKALTANVATLTTAAAHGLVVGNVVDVTGVDAVFNGRFIIASVPTTTTLTYPKTNADVTSAVSTGTVTHVDPARPESEVDYPTMSEEERTHDGLWVKAVGGLANT